MLLVLSRSFSHSLSLARSLSLSLTLSLAVAVALAVALALPISMHDTIQDTCMRCFESRRTASQHVHANLHTIIPTTIQCCNTIINLASPRTLQGICKRITHVIDALFPEKSLLTHTSSSSHPAGRIKKNPASDLRLGKHSTRPSNQLSGAGRAANGANGGEGVDGEAGHTSSGEGQGGVTERAPLQMSPLEKMWLLSAISNRIA